MNLAKIFFCVVSSALFAGCMATPKQDYSEFIASNPKTILVVMPESESSDVESGPAVLSTAIVPLAQRGYYVIPATLANDTFRYNGITEAAEIRKINRDKLREIFGADAILDITITDYGSKYVLLKSFYLVSGKAKLIDLRTNKILWEETVFAKSDSGGSSDPIGMLIGALLKHIIDNVTDKGLYTSAVAAERLFSPYLPGSPFLYGPKSPQYRQDEVLTKNQ